MVGLFMGMSDADKRLITGDLEKAPEGSKMVSPNYSRNDFLRSIQLGKLTEEQLQKFYRHLDVMDEFHKNGGAMGLLREQVEDKIGDYEPGYKTKIVFDNRIIDGGLNGSNTNSITILRDLYGSIRIEDYCTELFIKEKVGVNDGIYLAEFHCLNYKLGEKAEIIENAYNKLMNSNNLAHAIDIQAINALKSTATRNAIDYPYAVLQYHSLKKTEKGFVIKFLVQEL